MVDKLLKNGMIVTVNKERKIYYHGAMAVTGDRITEVGETKELEEKCKDAKEVIDLDGKIIFPGFINTHNHLFQTLLKGLGDDMVLSDWLATMTFPAAQYLEPEDCYYGAMLGCMEGIRSGMATKALHGCEGTDCLEKLGILGDNVLMVHCVYLNDKDIRRAKYYDLKVSHNPVSNMYLSSGVAPIPKLLNAGVTCGLGVDGAASNNGQDMIELMKTASLLQKVDTLDPTVITAEKVLEMATIDGARAIGMEDEIGSLEVGKKADFVIFNPYLNPKAIPVHNPVSTLVYSSTMQNIESVAVDGEFILKDGVMTTIADEQKVLHGAQKTAESLCERGKITNRLDGHQWKSIAF